jgi:uncharacterized membrane protein YidH (DUF202 family)
MGPLGIICVAFGAILYWAIDVDPEYVDKDALGVVLMLVGVLALAMAGLMRGPVGESGAMAGLALVGAGAAVVWAIDVDIRYVYDDALGLILLVAGLLALAASGIANVRSRRRVERRVEHLDNTR